MQKNEYGLRKINWGIAIFLLIVSLVFGYYLAAGMEPGFYIYDWLDKMQNVVFQNPFRVYWNQYSLLCIFVAFLFYSCAGLYYLTTAKNYMKGQEFGTAKYGEPKKLNKELANLSKDINDTENIVLSCQKRWFGKKVYKIERK